MKKVLYDELKIVFFVGSTKLKLFISDKKSTNQINDPNDYVTNSIGEKYNWNMRVEVKFKSVK